MHHEITLDCERRLVCVTVTGPCTVEDMREVQRAVAATPGFEPTFSQLGDFSGVTQFEASVLDLIALARHAPFAAGAIRAYVATPSWAFGMLRKYTLASETIGRGGVRVFNDRAAALAWIEQGEAARSAEEATRQDRVI